MLLSGNHARIDGWRAEQSRRGASCERRRGSAGGDEAGRRGRREHRPPARPAEPEPPPARSAPSPSGRRWSLASRAVHAHRLDPAASGPRVPRTRLAAPSPQPRAAPPPPDRTLRRRRRPPALAQPVDRLTRGLPDTSRVTIDWIVTIVGAVAIVLLVKAFVVNPYRIPSSSMEPTLHCARPAPGCEARFSDRVLANRFIYHLRDPRRGEIVVFKTPPAPGSSAAPAGRSSSA